MRALPLARRAFCATLILSWWTAPSHGQLLGPLLPLATTPAQEEAATQEARADANSDALRVAQRNLETAGASDETAAQAVAQLQSKGAVLAQQQAVDRRIKDLEARKAQLESQLAAPDNETPNACTFQELDALKDELAAERSREQIIADKLTAGKAAVERAQRALDESNVKRRQAQEAAERGKAGPQASELGAAAEQARLAAETAAEVLTLSKGEVQRDELALAVQRLAVKVSEKKLARMARSVDFREADYEAQLAEISVKEEAARKSLARAQASLPELDRQIQQTQAELESETGDRAVLQEKLEAQRKTQEKVSDEIESITQRLQWYGDLRLAWSRRFQVATRSVSGKIAWEEIKGWQKETLKELDDLAAALRAQILRMRDIRATLTSIRKKGEAAKDAAPELRNWIEMQTLQAEAMLRNREKDLVAIEASRRVHEKLLEEIGFGEAALSPTSLAMSAWHQAKQLWEMELAELDDRSITIGKVVTAVSVFVVGWLLSRLLSVVFANRLLKRFRLSKDATAAIRALAFYLLLVVVVVVALRIVNVPLTAFTILGGALAIGIGFGSQALINNFIGGLIMLAERPVRLGERITFGSHDGVVEEVGFRCTKLRTLTDNLVTIPNSTLINESIENVGRRRTIRRLMNVRIACDTPRGKVVAAVQAIRDILEEKEIRERIHPIIGFEELSPRVFFNDFSAEGLNVLVLYWYAPPEWWAYVEHSQRVNLRIMEEFERLGVEFAFPSRTVYAKTQGETSQVPLANGSNGSKVHVAAGA